MLPPMMRRSQVVSSGGDVDTPIEKWLRTCVNIYIYIYTYVCVYIYVRVCVSGISQ